MSRPLPKEWTDPRTYLRGKWMVFDFETNGIDFTEPYWHDPSKRVIMVAWKLRGEKTKHHVGNLLEAKEFWEDVERADYLVAHNVKFEAHFMAKSGYDPTQKLWGDSKLAEKVRLGNRQMSTTLGDVAERYGYKAKDPVIDEAMKAGMCPTEMPQKRLLARCRRDVRTTEQVWRAQLRVLRDRKQLGVLLNRCLLTPILAMMEREGMCLDKERVYEQYGRYSQRRAELKQEFDKITGGVNQNSPKQMAEYLYDVLKFPEPKGPNGKPRRTKAGGRKTDKQTIEWLIGQAKTKKQREFFRLRQELGKVDAALSKNLEFFKGVVDETSTGTFHAVFNQDRTATHRLSSSGLATKFDQFPKEKSVQFQNMPRIFKPLFKSRDPDYLLTEADGSQLEFRVAGYLGRDPQIARDVADPDFDAHVKSASVMNVIDYADALVRHRAKDPEMKVLRTDAKPETFKPLYGGEKGTEAQERWYKEFQKRYAVLYKTQEGWLDNVLADGYLQTEWGMRWYWRFRINPAGVAIDNYSGKPIKPSVFNYPVQSLATAEIIPAVVVLLYHRVKAAGLRVRFVNTVHDSIIAEVHKEDLEAYKELVFQAFGPDVYRFLKVVFGIKFTIPLGTEIGWGTHWSDKDNEEESRDFKPLYGGIAQ